MEFERTSRRPLSLQLTPLIDVMFILIIFFMLTSSFMKVESLELMLPSAKGGGNSKQQVVHLFVEDNGELILGQRHLKEEELGESLIRIFSKDAATPVMLLTSEGVSMQQLVEVMDKVYASGGRSLYVRKWEKTPAAPDLPVSVPEE